MSPIVRIASGKEPNAEVFISLERTPLVLADMRRALPLLRKELTKKWPVKYVEIENQMPRRRNPYDPSQIVAVARIGLAVGFIAATKQIGDAVGKEIGKHARRWIRNLGKSKQGRRRSR